MPKATRVRLRVLWNVPRRFTLENHRPSLADLPSSQQNQQRSRSLETLCGREVHRATENPRGAVRNLWRKQLLCG